MKETPKIKKQPNLAWLIYLSLIVSALMLLGDGLNISFLAKMTTRLGGTILFGAFFLIAGRNRPQGFIATAILVIAFIITLFN